jgi:hypothetical protein
MTVRLVHARSSAELAAGWRAANILDDVASRPAMA